MEKSIIHSASRQPSQRFEVKLDDSSFLVSLKKLQTERGEGNKDGAPSHDKLRIDPALEARFDPRNEVTTTLTSHRLRAFPFSTPGDLIISGTSRSRAIRTGTGTPITTTPEPVQFCN